MKTSQLTEYSKWILRLFRSIEVENAGGCVETIEKNNVDLNIT